MKKNEAFPSKYIKTEDLEGRDWTLTIERVIKEVIKGDDGAEKEKAVLYFRGSHRGWVLNGINWDSIAGLHGDDSEDWTGKKVIVHPDKTSFGNKVVPCIRVRTGKPIPKHQKQAMEMTENPAEDMDEDIPF